MLKRLRQYFEKIAYAGLEPQGGRPAQKASDSPKAEAAKSKSPGGMRAWLEGKLTQAGPADPLYLSNRTFAQRAKAWALIAVPVVIILATVGLALSGVFRSEAPVTPVVLTPPNADAAAKVLADLKPDLRIESQHDLEIDDVHVVKGSPLHLAGMAKNTTDHEIAKAELVFDLTDKTGSRQGAVSTELKNIRPNAMTPFDFPIEQTTVSFALVREIRLQ
jgi:hypothetical protein